jgi:hypothetical protein
MANDNTFIDLQRLSQMMEVFKSITNASTSSIDEFLKKFDKMSEFKEFEKLISSTTSKIDLLRSEYENAAKQLNGLSLETKSLVSNFEFTNDAADKASASFKKISDEIKKINTSATDDEILIMMKNLKNSAEELHEQIQLVGEDIQDFGNLSLKAGNSLDKLGKSLGIVNKVSDIKNGFLSRTVDLIARRDFVKLNVLLGATAKSFINIFHPLNISNNMMSSYISKTKQLVLEFDKANTEINRTTATLDKYTQVISDARDEGAAYGATHADFSAIISESNLRFHAFNKLTEKNKTNISGIINLYSKFNVNSSLLVQTMGNLTDTFKDNGEIGRKYLAETFTLNGKLGKNLSDTISELNNNFSRLSRFGAKQMLTVFKDLQSFSKSLGIEMSSLLQITEQFDTYSDASQAVGKFNAILGGPYLNAIQLMRVSDEERLQIIKNQVDALGIQYDSLHEQEKQVLASAIGIKDMDQAQKFFTGSIYDYNNARKAQAATEEEVKKQAQKQQTAIEKISNAFVSLIDILDPFLWLFRTVATAIADFLLIGDGLAGKLTVIAGSLAFLILKGPKLFSFIKGFSSGIKNIVQNLISWGASSKAAAASNNILQTSSSLGTIKSIQNASATNLMTTALSRRNAAAAMTAAATKAANAATVVNTTVAGANTSALAGNTLATGKNAAVQRLAAVSAKLSTGAFAAMGATFGALGAAMIKGAGIMALFGLGLAGMGAGAWVLGKGLASIGDGLSSIIDAFSSEGRRHKRMMELANVPDNSHKNWDLIATAVEKLSKAISNSDIDKLEAFTDMAGNDNIAKFKVVNDILNNVSDNSTSNSQSVNKTKEVIEQITKLNEKADSSNIRAASELVKTINGSTQSNSEVNSRPIIIQLDNLVLAKWHEKTHDRGIRSGIPVNVYK